MLAKRKVWKIVKYLAYAALGVFAAVFLAIFIFGRFDHRPIQQADAIVVLGAAVNTPSLYNRSLEGLRLYEAGDARVLVLSGGVDYPGAISEAQYMRKVINAYATHPVTLILDDQSHSTFENLQNTREKIGRGKSLIIVSDQFHLARAALTAKSLGFGPIYWSSPEPSYFSFSELLFYYVRETAAMIWYVPKFVTGR